jgi:hypothetical protein
MAFKSKVQNKFLTGQSREIISSLLQFMTLEARENAPIIPLSKVLELFLLINKANKHRFGAFGVIFSD